MRRTIDLDTTHKILYSRIQQIASLSGGFMPNVLVESEYLLMDPASDVVHFAGLWSSTELETARATFSQARNSRRRKSSLLCNSMADVPASFVQDGNYVVLIPKILPDVRVMVSGLYTIMFADISGFSHLSERLSAYPDGAELLTRYLNALFEPMIQSVTTYRGDVMKFSGDALTVIFEAVQHTTAELTCVDTHIPVGLQSLRMDFCLCSCPEVKNPSDTGQFYDIPSTEGPHHTIDEAIKHGLPDNAARYAAAVKRCKNPKCIINELQDSARRACCCAYELHRITNRVAKAMNLELSLHIGISSGYLSIPEVGGFGFSDNQFCTQQYVGSSERDLVVVGPCVGSVVAAEPLAKSHETVVAADCRVLLGNHFRFELVPGVSEPFYLIHQWKKQMSLGIPTATFGWKRRSTNPEQPSAFEIGLGVKEKVLVLPVVDTGILEQVVDSDWSVKGFNSSESSSDEDMTLEQSFIYKHQKNSTSPLRYSIPEQKLILYSSDISDDLKTSENLDHCLVKQINESKRFEDISSMQRRTFDSQSITNVSDNIGRSSLKRSVLLPSKSELKQSKLYFAGVNVDQVQNIEDNKKPNEVVNYQTLTNHPSNIITNSYHQVLNKSYPSNSILPFQNYNTCNIRYSGNISNNTILKNSISYRTIQTGYDNQSLNSISLAKPSIPHNYIKYSNNTYFTNNINHSNMITSQSAPNGIPQCHYSTESTTQYSKYITLASSNTTTSQYIKNDLENNTNEFSNIENENNKISPAILQTSNQFSSGQKQYLDTKGNIFRNKQINKKTESTQGKQLEVKNEFLHLPWSSKELVQLGRRQRMIKTSWETPGKTAFAAVLSASRFTPWLTDKSEKKKRNLVESNSDSDSLMSADSHPSTVFRWIKRSHCTEEVLSELYKKVTEALHLRATTLAWLKKSSKHYLNHSKILHNASISTRVTEHDRFSRIKKWKRKFIPGKKNNEVSIKVPQNIISINSFNMCDVGSALVVGKRHLQETKQKFNEKLKSSWSVSKSAKLTPKKKVQLDTDCMEINKAQVDKIMYLAGRYVPPFVFETILAHGTRYDRHVNEILDISILFVIGQTPNMTLHLLDALMRTTQAIIFSEEGTVNKMVTDDKGIVLLCAFGLYPLKHVDDARRSAFSAFQLIRSASALGAQLRCGVASGKAFCGVVGSAQRREYTIMGSCVNLAARLAQSARPFTVMCEEQSIRALHGDVIFASPISRKFKGIDRNIVCAEAVRELTYHRIVRNPNGEPPAGVFHVVEDQRIVLLKWNDLHQELCGDKLNCLKDKEESINNSIQLESHELAKVLTRRFLGPPAEKPHRVHKQWPCLRTLNRIIRKLWAIKGTRKHSVLWVLASASEWEAIQLVCQKIQYAVESQIHLPVDQRTKINSAKRMETAPLVDLLRSCIELLSYDTLVCPLAFTLSYIPIELRIEALGLIGAMCLRVAPAEILHKNSILSNKDSFLPPDAFKKNSTPQTCRTGNSRTSRTSQGLSSLKRKNDLFNHIIRRSTARTRLLSTELESKVLEDSSDDILFSVSETIQKTYQHSDLLCEKCNALLRESQEYLNQRRKADWDSLPNTPRSDSVSKNVFAGMSETNTLSMLLSPVPRYSAIVHRDEVGKKIPYNKGLYQIPNENNAHKLYRDISSTSSDSNKTEIHNAGAQQFDIYDPLRKSLSDIQKTPGENKQKGQFMSLLQLALILFMEVRKTHEIVLFLRMMPVTGNFYTQSQQQLQQLTSLFDSVLNGLVSKCAQNESEVLRESCNNEMCFAESQRRITEEHGIFANDSDSNTSKRNYKHNISINSNVTSVGTNPQSRLSSDNKFQLNSNISCQASRSFGYTNIGPSSSHTQHKYQYDVKKQQITSNHSNYSSSGIANGTYSNKPISNNIRFNLENYISKKQNNSDSNMVTKLGSAKTNIPLSTNYSSTFSGNRIKYINPILKTVGPNKTVYPTNTVIKGRTLISSGRNKSYNYDSHIKMANGKYQNPVIKYRQPILGQKVITTSSKNNFPSSNNILYTDKYCDSNRCQTNQPKKVTTFKADITKHFGSQIKYSRPLNAPREARTYLKSTLKRYSGYRNASALINNVVSQVASVGNYTNQAKDISNAKSRNLDVKPRSVTSNLSSLINVVSPHYIELDNSKLTRMNCYYVNNPINNIGGSGDLIIYPYENIYGSNLTDASSSTTYNITRNSFDEQYAYTFLNQPVGEISKNTSVNKETIKNITIPSKLLDYDQRIVIDEEIFENQPYNRYNKHIIRRSRSVDKIYPIHAEYNLNYLVEKPKLIANQKYKFNTKDLYASAPSMPSTKTLLAMPITPAWNNKPLHGPSFKTSNEFSLSPSQGQYSSGYNHTRLSRFNKFINNKNESNQIEIYSGALTPRESCLTEALYVYPVKVRTDSNNSGSSIVNIRKLTSSKEYPNNEIHIQRNNVPEDIMHTFSWDADTFYKSPKYIHGLKIGCPGNTQNLSPKIRNLDFNRFQTKSGYKDLSNIQSLRQRGKTDHTNTYYFSNVGQGVPPASIVNRGKNISLSSELENYSKLSREKQSLKNFAIQDTETVVLPEKRSNFRISLKEEKKIAEKEVKEKSNICNKRKVNSDGNSIFLASSPVNKSVFSTKKQTRNTIDIFNNKVSSLSYIKKSTVSKNSNDFCKDTPQVEKSINSSAKKSTYKSSNFSSRNRKTEEWLKRVTNTPESGARKLRSKFQDRYYNFRSRSSGIYDRIKEPESIKYECQDNIIHDWQNENLTHESFSSIKSVLLVPIIDKTQFLSADVPRDHILRLAPLRSVDVLTYVNELIFDAPPEFNDIYSDTDDESVDLSEQSTPEEIQTIDISTTPKIKSVQPWSFYNLLQGIGLLGPLSKPWLNCAEDISDIQDKSSEGLTESITNYNKLRQEKSDENYKISRAVDNSKNNRISTKTQKTLKTESFENCKSSFPECNGAPDSFVETILRSTNGNPVKLEAVLRAVRAQNPSVTPAELLSVSATVLKFDPPTSSDTMTRSAWHLFQVARPHERAILKVASVLQGPLMLQDVLSWAVGFRGDRLGAAVPYISALQGLLSSKLLIPVDQSFLCYSSLPEELRRYPVFHLFDTLIFRSVILSRIPHGERTKIKRQALISRALAIASQNKKT